MLAKITDELSTLKNATIFIRFIGRGRHVFSLMFHSKEGCSSDNLALRLAEWNFNILYNYRSEIFQVGVTGNVSICWQPRCPCKGVSISSLNLYELVWRYSQAC